MSITRGLNNGGVEQSQMIERLNGGKGLQVSPLLNVIVVQKEKSQTFKTNQIFFGRKQNNTIER